MPNVWIEKRTYLAYGREYDNPDEAIQEVVEEQKP